MGFVTRNDDQEALEALVALAQDRQDHLPVLLKAVHLPQSQVAALEGQSLLRRHPPVLRVARQLRNQVRLPAISIASLLENTQAKLPQSILQIRSSKSEKSLMSSQNGQLRTTIERSTFILVEDTAMIRWEQF